jgi:hypothetical protein
MSASVIDVDLACQADVVTQVTNSLSFTPLSLPAAGFARDLFAPFLATPVAQGSFAKPKPNRSPSSALAVSSVSLDYNVQIEISTAFYYFAVASALVSRALRRMAALR